MRREAIQPAEEAIQIEFGGVRLSADLAIPNEARGLIIFAHGSGSGRHSPRNRFVASELQSSGLCTLLLDLLTADEEEIDEQTRRLRFDIDLLNERVIGAVDWASAQPATRGLSIGLFGASTGAAAALVAAARRPDHVRATVSRGGRPDLAGDWLPRVLAPTLLIVGGDDSEVSDLNELALRRLRCEKSMEIIHGATHLFEEPGALEEVANLATAWFEKNLA